MCKDENISMNNAGVMPCRGPLCRALHQLVVSLQGADGIDHINHNRGLCIESNLRRYTGSQNSWNSARYINKNHVVFSDGTYDNGKWIPGYRFRCEIENTVKNRNVLTGMGFYFKTADKGAKLKAISTLCPTKGDCYSFMRDFYELVHGDFVYKLEEDFSDSLDLLIYHYVFHIVSEKTIKKRNLERLEKKYDSDYCRYAR